METNFQKTRLFFVKKAQKNCEMFSYEPEAPYKSI